jgi:hypothetical protein
MREFAVHAYLYRRDPGDREAVGAAAPVDTPRPLTPLGGA